MTESHQRWFHNLFQLRKLLAWQITDEALSPEPGERGFMSRVMSYGVMVLWCQGEDVYWTGKRTAMVFVSVLLC